jgi:8-oxo-dGTP diphosphatase
MAVPDFYEYDPRTKDSKGLVFIEDDILVYRRDTKTDAYPLKLDLPGGGVEGTETPFETFKREVREEFGLAIARQDIVYARMYPDVEHRASIYFAVAQLPGNIATDIAFGDEGIEYYIMKPDIFTQRSDAIPLLQTCTLEYLRTRST